MIPGQGNHLRVVNGSAHGLGIYAATIDYPQLALGFSSRRRCPCCRGYRAIDEKWKISMLVCAVLDDSVPLTQPETLGDYQ